MFFSDCRLTNVNRIEKYIFVEKYGMNKSFGVVIASSCHHAGSSLTRNTQFSS